MNPVLQLKELTRLTQEGCFDAIGYIEDNFILETGKPIRFEPWQKEKVLEPVVTLENGKRPYDTYLIGLPKKNGKSTMASAIAIYGLLLD